MLRVCCSRCDKELHDNGAVAWGPPDHMWLCPKVHMCIDCWAAFLRFLDEGNVADVEPLQRMGGPISGDKP